MKRAIKCLWSEDVGAVVIGTCSTVTRQPREIIARRKASKLDLAPQSGADRTPRIPPCDVCIPPSDVSPSRSGHIDNKSIAQSSQSTVSSFQSAVSNPGGSFDRLKLTLNQSPNVNTTKTSLMYIDNYLQLCLIKCKS